MIDTLQIELRQTAAQGHRGVILTPGNYGQDFLRQCGLGGGRIPVIRCSNFVGEALDGAAAEGFKRVLLVGHVGKLVKLAGGIMNTHSRWGDCRTELFCAHAAVCGAGQSTCQALLEGATTDACLEILEQASLPGSGDGPPDGRHRGPCLPPGRRCLSCRGNPVLPCVWGVG